MEGPRVVYPDSNKVGIFTRPPAARKSREPCTGACAATPK
jgi:hypothetical protein